MRPAIRYEDGGRRAYPDPRVMILDQIVADVSNERDATMDERLFLLRDTDAVMWSDEWFEEVDQFEAFVQYTRNNLCAGS